MSAAILDHLWQSTLFAGAAGLLTLLLRGNAARVRFWVWFMASVKFLVPFAALAALGGWLLPRPQAPLPMLEGFAPEAEPYVMPLANAHVLTAAPAHAVFNWSLLVLAVWGLGTLAIALHWLSRWLGLRAAMARAGNVIVIGAVGVRITPQPLEPGLFGIWRPVILLPQGIENRLSQAELDAVLAHEACHMRHRDNLWAAIHMLVEALFWFHPLVWWLGARLNHERERACDEAVVAAGQAPEVYAESILKVCRLYVHSPLACVAGVSGADLKERIERIVMESAVRPLGPLRKLLLAGLGVASLALPVAVGLVMVPAAVHALGEDHPSNVPISIRSDSFHANPETKSGFWTGNVVVTQGDMTLRSNQARVLTVSGKPDKIYVSGNVVVDSPNSGTATGENGVYSVRLRTMVMTGDVVLQKKGKGEFHGSQLTLNMNTGQGEFAPNSQSQ